VHELEQTAIVATCTVQQLKKKVVTAYKTASKSQEINISRKGFTLTEVFINLTEVFLTLTEVFINLTEVFINLTEVFINLRFFLH